MVVAQSILYEKKGLSKITYTCYFEEKEAHEGDTVTFIEEITNAKLLPVPWLKSELTTSKWLLFSELQSTVSDKTRFVSSFFMLKSYHKIVRKWKVTCLKRGVFAIDKAILVSTDLFGQVNTSFPVILDENMKITVIPRPLSLTEIINGDQRLYGETLIRHRLIADPFYINGIREYYEGEPEKRISWTATARMNEIMVFNNDYTTDCNVAIIMNILSRENDYKSIFSESGIEHCIKIAASLFAEAEAKNLPFKFMCNSADKFENPIVTPEGMGIEHADNLMRILAELEFTSTSSFEDFLESGCNLLPDTDIYIVTCYLNNEIIRFANSCKNCTLILAMSGEVYDTLPDCRLINLAKEADAV